MDLSENVCDNFRTVKQSSTEQKTLLKRARAKYFSLGLVFKLTNLDSPLQQKYWNTYYCAKTLRKEKDKITSRYCKNRWCLVCNRIRTAINIKKYSPELKNWDKAERCFVTLTIPNIGEVDLRNSIDTMLENFKNIRRVMQINRHIKLVGLRKLECTYNPIRNDYHPHFHCIVKGEIEAKMLVGEWLKRYPLAEEYCQDVRHGNDNDVMELFKYFTKIISSKSAKVSNENTAPVEYRQRIYIHALDVIFQAVSGRRTFQNFGFKGQQVDEEKEEIINTDNELNDKIEFYSWEAEIADWLNMDTGECLTGYVPSQGLTRLIDSAQ